MAGGGGEIHGPDLVTCTHLEAHRFAARVAHPASERNQLITDRARLIEATHEANRERLLPQGLEIRVRVFVAVTGRIGEDSVGDGGGLLEAPLEIERPAAPRLDVGASRAVVQTCRDRAGLVEIDERVSMIEDEALRVASPDQPPHPQPIVGEAVERILVLVHQLSQLRQRRPVVEQDRPVEDRLDDGSVGSISGLGRPRRVVGALEVGLGFDEGVPIHRLEPGASQIVDRLVDDAALAVVECQRLGHLFEATGKLFLDRRRGTGMETRSLGLEESVVGDILGERMLEEVLEVGLVRSLADEVGALEIRQGRIELIGRGRHLPDDVVEELPSDDRCFLEHAPPAGLETIDPGRDHAADRRRHICVDEAARDAPAAVGFDECARLDQRVDDLLEVEGIAVGTRGQEVDQLLRRRVRVEERRGELSRLAW